MYREDDDFFAEPDHPTLAELDAYEARALGAEDPEAPWVLTREIHGIQIRITPASQYVIRSR